jgi:hypothetical protein
MDEYYILLELELGASIEEVKSARRELLQVWHPDRFKHKPDLAQRAEEKSKRINDAADRLIEYIRSGQQERTQSSSQTKAPPTSPGYGEGAGSGVPTSQPSASGSTAANGRVKVFIAGLIIVALLGVGSVVQSFLKSQSKSQGGSPISRTLIYPGSRVVLDLANEGGGSVLQMGTSDALDKVQSWYISNLQPTKVLQVTSGTVIMRKDNVTATLVAENNSTNIVIKQSAP